MEENKLNFLLIILRRLKFATTFLITLSPYHLITLSFYLLIFCISSSATVLNKKEMDEVMCAASKMQLFYYYFSPERDSKVLNYEIKCKGRAAIYSYPKWLEQNIPKMQSTKVWRDPEEGEITEAQLWQTPISILYEFFDVTKKTFPPEYGGANIQPGLLVKEYADIRIRFQMSLDRLYRARLFDSMQGRGRSLLGEFHLIFKQMESVAAGLSSMNAVRYAQAVTAIAVFSQSSFSLMFKNPRMYSPDKKESPMQRVITFALVIVGMIMVFIGVRVFFSLNKAKMDEIVAEHTRKVSQWTQDFSRQFMEVKVQYLIAIPAGIFALLGILTFSVIGFVILTLLGIFVGLRTPQWFLEWIKTQRGKKIDGQLMDALILLSNCLKSGLDIVQGFEMVSKDLIPPISDEFGLVIKNYRLGMPFEKALLFMEQRVTSKMLSYMIKAIILQRQMGGNLTKVFERIVIDIREESKLEEKTKALTAQQKIQSVVVGIMPWVLIGVMFMFQPQIMINFYGTGIGFMILIFCVVWVAIGMKMVNALGKIKV